MKTLITQSLIAGLIMLTVSCTDEKDISNHKNETLTIQTDDYQWTYISLETGRSIGTSRIGDQDADNEWSRRTDWDIAICKDVIRTNSGTSGCGNGGIQITDQKFEQILEAPQSGYETDTDNIAIW